MDEWNSHRRSRRVRAIEVSTVISKELQVKLKLIIVYKPLVFESLKFDCSHKSMHGLALKITVEVN